MLDIGAMELFVIAVLALVVVGPKELPKLLRSVGGLVRKARELTAEFRDGIETLAAEAEREIDPFADEKRKEGLRPGMSPDDITNHIMGNKEVQEADVSVKKASTAKSTNPVKSTVKTKKNETKQ